MMFPAVLLTLTIGLVQDHNRKAAPFSAVRWDGETPIVQVEGDWYRWTTIDHIEVTAIVEFCQGRWPGRWKKRVGEDLIEAIVGMGENVGEKVDLGLIGLESDEELVRKDVAMTRAKRELVEDYNDDHDADELAKPAEPEGNRRSVLTRMDAQADLLELELILDRSYSYRHLNGVDLKKNIRNAVDSIGDETTIPELGICLMKLLAPFGDGHTRLRGSAAVLPPGYLPVSLVAHGDRIVALEDDGTGAFNQNFPYLKAIDGKPIEEWMEAVSSIVPHGAEHFIRRMCLDRLVFLNFARIELGVELDGSVELELASDSGDTTTADLPVARRPSRGRMFPEQGSRTIDGNIGYLRIPSMDSGDRFRTWIHDSMESLRDTKGLIIDVRDNGGGSREALRTLFPYLMKPGDAPHIANIAAYRLQPGEPAKTPEGYLANRACYPLNWDGWNRDEEKVLKKAERSFKPDWKLPRGHFSDWHYMMLSHERGEARFHYDRPVVVLVDGGCFSATDIFLGAFHGWRDVTLMGETSGGGSGRSRPYRLPQSRLEIRVSSMASFRPTGQRYDGLGVAPDVVLTPTLSDLVGETDTVLDAAVRHLGGDG